MTALLAHLRFIVAALALVFVVAIAAPAAAQQPSSVNPTAAAVQEDQLLNALRGGGVIDGRVTIPDAKSAVLIQPAGLDWRHFHQVTLQRVGAVAIIGVFALLILFFLVRGRIRLASGFSGQTILRFNAFERFMHWMTAVSFIVLGLSGLNLTFGKSLLLPYISPEAFTALSQWGKYAHNYLSFPFALGVIFMFLIWIKDNFPTGTDVQWLKQGGGLVGQAHPPARRFNAGQKIIFWIVILGGTAVSVSGYYLMFPFYETGIAWMQFWQIVHALVAVLMVAAILAHIYIGTIGMEGAYQAMSTGQVDVNWAKEHHSLWAEKELGKTAGAPPAQGRMAPAE